MAKSVTIVMFSEIIQIGVPSQCPTTSIISAMKTQLVRYDSICSRRKCNIVCLSLYIKSINNFNETSARELYSFTIDKYPTQDSISRHQNSCNSYRRIMPGSY